jgi:glyceraldehyde-3-phosphate dehydrogenase (NADP+)
VLAFIGSARVASMLKQQHPRPNRCAACSGLEAKNAAVILPHADLELAVRECALGALSYNGQRCTAIKIIFAHRSVADGSASVRRGVGELTVGMPWDEGVTDHAAARRRQARSGCRSSSPTPCAAARRSSTPAAARSTRRCTTPPCSIRPRPTWRSARSSSSAPSCRSCRTTTSSEVIDWAVNSPVGQQAALFGSDPQRLSGLIDPLVNQVCRVNINSQCQRGPDTFPFTGRKDSAEGTLSVSDALRVFSIRSLVAAKANDTNEQIVSRDRARPALEVPVDGFHFLPPSPPWRSFST